MNRIMTSENHSTGTDRVGEVAEKISADLYIITLATINPTAKKLSFINTGFQKNFLFIFNRRSNIEENYLKNSLAFVSKKAVFDALNMGIEKIINKFSKEISIEFLTTEKYIHLQ